MPAETRYGSTCSSTACTGCSADLADRAARFYLMIGELSRVEEARPEVSCATRTCCSPTCTSSTSSSSATAPLIAAAVDRVRATGEATLVEAAASAVPPRSPRRQSGRCGGSEHWDGLVAWFRRRGRRAAHRRAARRPHDGRHRRPGRASARGNRGSPLRASAATPSFATSPRGAGRPPPTARPPPVVGGIGRPLSAAPVRRAPRRRGRALGSQLVDRAAGPGGRYARRAGACAESGSAHAGPRRHRRARRRAGAGSSPVGGPRPRRRRR